MATEDNKALVSRYIEEGVNQRNMAVLNELYDPDVVFYNYPLTVQGRAYAIQNFSVYFTAFPDCSMTIEDMLAEGNTVVFRHIFRGTHKGNLLSIPPTGKQVTEIGITIFRIADGKIVEQWTSG